MACQVFSFLLVGALGFFIDASITQVLVSFFDIGQFIARAPAILASVCVTFYFNKNHTFAAREACMKKTASMYAVTTCVSIIVNYSVYSALISWLEFSHHLTFLAVGAGALIAATGTFILSKYWVFKDEAVIS